MNQVQDVPAPIFIGLDLSLTSTGVAVIHGDRISVTRITSKPDGKDTISQAHRLHQIRSQIMACVPLTEHTFVAVEGPSYASTGSGAHILGGIWWGVRGDLWLEAIPTVVIPPSSVKKYATGKGNAGKDAVLAAVIRRYPDVDVTGNDQADALVLAAMCARYHGAPIEPDLHGTFIDAMRGVGR